MQQQIQFNLNTYVVSSFLLLPLTGTTSILSGVVGGAIKLPTAKFIDLVGRAEGFLLMTAFATLGMSAFASLRAWFADFIRSRYDGGLQKRRDIRCSSGGISPLFLRFSDSKESR